MKKPLLILSFLLLFFSISAQENEERSKGKLNKKGENILPEAGDFSLGFDANPLFYYIGNLFNNTSDNHLNFIGQDYAISGKYFFKDNQALRAKISFNINNSQTKSWVHNDKNDENLYSQKEDVKNSNNFMLNLTGGYEFRRGYGRLQAFYGPQLGFGFHSRKYTYEYGNAITETNPYPTTTTFDNFYYTGYRPLSANTGLLFSVNVGAFVGVEYFIARKISVGCELGLNLVYKTKGEGEVESELFDGKRVIVGTEKWRGYQEVNALGVNTDVYGNLSFNFYF